MEHRGAWAHCVLLLCSLGLMTAPVAGLGNVADTDQPTALTAEEGFDSAVQTASSADTIRLLADRDQSESASLLQEGQPAADTTVTRIELAPDGSATWTLTIRTRLDTDGSVEDYRQFQESFRANTSHYLDTFERRMTGVVSEANESFGREMRATSFDANTSIQEVPQRWGVVTYRFTWQGFAATEDDSLVVGDVFAGGFFIDDGDALEIAVPEGYEFTDVAPSPAQSHDNVVEWYGREDFADGRPHVVAVPAENTGGSLVSFDTVPRALLGGALLVAVLLGVGATSLRGGRRNPVVTLGSRLRADSSTGSDGGAGSAGAGPGDGTDGGSGAAADATEELLTDEDYVQALLADRGGRIKQGDVVEELDWSKSKTSRVLSRMAEEGTIRKLRIGRENIIESCDGDQPDDGTDAGERGSTGREDNRGWQT